MAGISGSVASDIMVETATVIGMVSGSGGSEGSEVGVDDQSAGLWPPLPPATLYTEGA